MSECLKAFSRAGIRQIDDVVENEMSFIECVVASRKLNGTTAVLLEKLPCIVFRFIWFLWFHAGQILVQESFRSTLMSLWHPGKETASFEPYED